MKIIDLYRDFRLFTGMLIISLFFFNINCKNMDEGNLLFPKYKVLTNDSLISLCEQYDGKFYKQVKSNTAIIEKLSNNTFVMLPAYGEKGIYFLDENIMEKMIEDCNYPIETDTGTFYELYRNEILNLEKSNSNESILFFEKKFNELCGLKFDYSFSNSFLNKLERVIKENRKDAIKLDELSVVTTILFNEGFRKAIDAKWWFDEQFSLNKFYVPIVNKEGNRININNAICDKFKISSYKLDFKELLIIALDDFLLQKNKSNNVFLFRKNLYQNLRTNFDKNFINYLKKVHENKPPLPPESFRMINDK